MPADPHNRSQAMNESLQRQKTVLEGVNMTIGAQAVTRGGDIVRKRRQRRLHAGFASLTVVVAVVLPSPALAYKEPTPQETSAQQHRLTAQEGSETVMRRLGPAWGVGIAVAAVVAGLLISNDDVNWEVKKNCISISIWQVRQCIIVRQLGIEAIRASNAEYPTTNAMSPAEARHQESMRDAFRHCVWSAEVTRVLGEFLARYFTDLHEYGNPSIQDVRMDLYNNQIGLLVGREIGLGRHLSDNEQTMLIQADCKFLAEIGYLITAQGTSPTTYDMRLTELRKTSSGITVEVPLELAVPQHPNLPSRRQ